MLTASSGEVAAVNVLDSLSALRRHWTALVLATGLGAALGIGAAFLVSPVWESETTVELGAVHGEPFEDAPALARFLGSDAFKRSLPPAIGDASSSILAGAVESPDDKGIAYLRIVVSAADPQRAAAIANHVASFVEARHKSLFEEQTRVYSDYASVLTQSIEELGLGIKRIEADAARVSEGSRDNVAGALIAQTQLASDRAQYAELSRELRDAKIEAMSRTKMTQAIGPASPPLSAVWPRKPFFAIVGAAVTLMLASVAVVALGRFQPTIR